GDADAIVLLDRPSGRSAIFIEGKVRGSQSTEWTLDEQFEMFRQGLTSRLHSSNLFTQLYHKARFVRAALGDEHGDLRNGVRFPSCSSKQVRRIGDNPVVLRALERVSPYLDDSYYLAIVPDTPSNVRTFVADILTPFAHDALPHWDV